MLFKMIDGPADGESLCGDRSPVFLRVVYLWARDAFAVLDDPADEPGASDGVYAYERIEPATYRFVQPQPGHQTLRKNPIWRAWCIGAVAKGMRQLIEAKE